MIVKSISLGIDTQPNKFSRSTTRGNHLLSARDHDNYRESKNRFQLSKSDTNTQKESSSINLFKIPKDYSSVSIINHGIGKNSISFFDRCLLKKETKKRKINLAISSSQIPGKSSSTKSIPHSQFNHYQTPTLKSHRPKSLCRLMNMKFDILPLKIKYSDQYLHSHSIKSRMPNQSHSTSEIFAKRFQTMKLSLKHPIKSETFLKKLLSIDSIETTKNLRLLSKVKLMKRLWQKKSFLVEKMITSYEHYKWFFDKYDQLDKATFKEMMLLIELGKDDEFVEQLYLIFGQNKDKTLKIKECLFFFIFASNTTYERKLHMLLDLVEDRNEYSLISIPCVMNYFKAFMSKNDYTICNSVFKTIAKKETMNKKALFIKLEKNESMKSLFYNYGLTLRNIDTKMNEEFDIILNNNMGKLL